MQLEDKEADHYHPDTLQRAEREDETWPLTLRDEEALRIFERKILRCILGGIQVNRSWRRRSSLELYKIYKQTDVVKFVKLQRLKWARHLARKNENRCCKKIFLAKPMGNRPRGRPPLRWIGCAETNLKILKVKNSKKVQKVEVQTTSGEGQGHPGLSSHRRRKNKLDNHAAKAARNINQTFGRKGTAIG
ncbi:uncharacterized transposon-derived protein F52C9.6 [Trichonephila clavipes]|nr:uncharacterized transposon-derived protein F52C9.6 [Trichonephila clavipes]